MNTVKSELARFNAPKDLKALLSAPGPCLSVYMPLSKASTVGENPNAKQNQLRWKECIATAENEAGKTGAPGRELVESIRDWQNIAAEIEGAHGSSIAVFRSADILQVALLDIEVPERAVLGPRFFIRPLLADLVRVQSFYLLALSQKNTRLLHCTRHESEEIRLPAQTQADFERWMNQVKPDHNAVYNAMSAGAQGASGPNALAPKGADAEAKDEYLSHFFKQIDRGVNEVLKGASEPLVLCAVEYEIPLYREVNNYPHLAEDAVRGAPNGLKSGEMHARALEALDRGYEKRVEHALAEWNHKVGGGASNRLKDVVVAAHDGRVLTLLISDSQEKSGVFDEATHSVKARETGTGEDEDLVNDAAVQTILHAGNVLVARAGKIPNGAPLAAIYRF